MKSERLANTIRQRMLEMVHRARASHIGSALSIADILAVLYSDVLEYDPADPEMETRDRFILSKGHACVAVYAVLAESGFFSTKLLEQYGADFSPLMNHVSHHVPGVEFSTGALGHGLPFGLGKAIAARIGSENWQVYVLLSDGELDEGSNWEALMFAAHHGVDNLHVIVDYNKLQSLDSIENTLGLEPLVEKLAAFGWFVDEVDGHSHEELQAAMLRKSPGFPHIIIAHTIKGKGVSFMENQVVWHYRNPSDEQLEMALTELAET